MGLPETGCLAHLRPSSIAYELVRTNTRDITSCDLPLLFVSGKDVCVSEHVRQPNLCPCFDLPQTLGALPIIGGYVLSDFQRNMMERTVRFSNEKAKEVLGINFMPLEEQVRVTISSMIDNGFVKPRPRTAAQ